MKPSFFQLVLSLIYPPVCIICRNRIDVTHDYPLCFDCGALIQSYQSPLCLRCGHALSAAAASQQCLSCRDIIFHFDRAMSACVYSGILRTCIHYFKYSGKLSLQTFFLKKMTEFLRDHLDIADIDALVPVPLHWTKQLDRGYNQAVIIAEGLAKALGRPAFVDALSRLRNTRSQFALNKSERMKNMAGVFACHQHQVIQGKQILLIDDIFTTGATANDCARALREAGAKCVTVYTLAR